METYQITRFYKKIINKSNHHVHTVIHSYIENENFEFQPQILSQLYHKVDSCKITSKYVNTTIFFKQIVIVCKSTF